MKMSSIPSRFVAMSAMVILVLAGCSKEQRRDLGEQDVRDVLSGLVDKAATDAGLDVQGDLTCMADITDQSAVTATCTGATATGETVSGTFTGTANVDDETCLADLALTIGEDISAEQGVNCFGQ